MINAALIAALIVAYLLGNVSPSILLGKMAGVDIKKEGSGNAGTTNTLRVLGKKAALFTLFVDIGKGGATAFGVILALEPVLALIAASTMIGTILITRRVSAGSVITAITLPFIANLMNPENLWWTLVLAVIILFKHTSNISRLVRGEEPPIQFKKKK